MNKPSISSAAETATRAHPNGERRRIPRARVSLTLRVCPSDFKDGNVEDVRATLNFSRKGFYFITPAEHYYKGMRVRITSLYGPFSGSGNWEDRGEVVRVRRLANGSLGVAVLSLTPIHSAASAKAREWPATPATAGAKNAERRASARYPLSSAVEVVELSSGARLSGRISDLGVAGCYIDMLNPFPEGTRLRLRFMYRTTPFETQGSVQMCDPAMGMGVAFVDLTPDQRSLLAEGLAELGEKHQAESTPVHQAGAVERPDGDHAGALVRLIKMLVRKGVLTEKESSELLRESLP